MSKYPSLVNATFHHDPMLSHFSIEVLEEARGARWTLLGLMPTEGLKRRAGTIAKQMAPATVWVVNRIKVEPDCFNQQAAA